MKCRSSSPRIRSISQRQDMKQRDSWTTQGASVSVSSFLSTALYGWIWEGGGGVSSSGFAMTRCGIPLWSLSHCRTRLANTATGGSGPCEDHVSKRGQRRPLAQASIVRARTRAHTHAHTRTHTRTHTRAHAHAHTHAHTHARAHTHGHTHAHAHTHTGTHTCTHTRAHTSTREQGRRRVNGAAA